jgi:hypothetical protein
MALRSVDLFQHAQRRLARLQKLGFVRFQAAVFGLTTLVVVLLPLRRFGSTLASVIRWPVRGRLPAGVSSLLCTPGDISILRRQIFRFTASAPAAKAET